LREASKTRSIWLNLCHFYSTPTATAPQTLHLERPIQLYNSHELEFLVLRLKSGWRRWRADDGRPFRTCETEGKFLEYVYLVEGGRWLLVVSKTGSIAYFDLDCTTPTKCILIPDQFDERFSTGLSMTIDRDCDSAFLMFNLAVSFRLSNEYVVHIWRVALARDDQQQGIGLTAIHLASFPLEHSIKAVYALSMRGPHLAVLGLASELSRLTFVIDWKKANGDLPNYPRRLIRPLHGMKPVWLAFLITPGGSY